MFRSIYKRIIEDFAFLRKFGFSYSCSIKSHIVPTVLFKKGDLGIRIGFNYEEEKMHIEWLPSLDAIEGYLLSESVEWKGSSYKDQIKSAKQFVKSFLKEQTEL